MSRLPNSNICLKSHERTKERVKLQICTITISKLGRNFHEINLGNREEMWGESMIFKIKIRW